MNNMEKYYINWSRITGNYLMFEVGRSDCIGIFKTKKEAEQFIQFYKDEQEAQKEATK